MKKWKISVSVIVATILLAIACVGAMVIKGYGVSAGIYLESKDGKPILVCENTPIVLSNRGEKDLFSGLNIGDTFLVIHDGIAESYPAQSGVYAVFKISNGTAGNIPQEVVNQLVDMGWLETDKQSDSLPSDVTAGGTFVGDLFDITVSYANWGDLNEIYANALNADKMMISSICHLPIYKFDTLTELNQFKNDVKEALTIDSGYDEVPSFNDSTAKYDEEFFAKNSLMLVYVEAGSGSFRYNVDSVYHANGKFCIHVMQTNDPETYTCDMAGWFITVAVSDDMISNCVDFDADLYNKSHP